MGAVEGLIGRGTYTAVAAVAIASFLVIAFYAVSSLGSMGGTAPKGSSSTINGVSSIQGSNQTIVATYVSSLGTQSAQITSTSSVTSTSTYSISTQSLVSGGSYTYTYSSQVKILTASAVISEGQSGKYLIFSVKFQNIGSGAIEVEGGGGSSLTAVVVSGSSIVKEVTGPRCEVATVMLPVGPGADNTARTPGCWSGYSYELTAPGIVQVQMTLTWSGDPASGSTGGSVQINAEFTLT